MAGEAYAGESITGRIGSSSFPLQARGGYIRVDEIPNLPRADLTMPTMAHPGINIPGRFASQEYINVAGKWAGMLQQQPLPEGFARAGERITRVAGMGQRAMGEAIGGGLQGVAEGLASVSNALSRRQRELEQSQKETAELKEDNAWQLAVAQFEAKAKKENIPASQWPEEFWKSDYAKEYHNIWEQQRNISPFMADKMDAKIASRGNAFLVKSIEADGNQSKAIDKNSVQLSKDLAIDKQDYNALITAIDAEHIAGHTDKAQHKANLLDAQNKHNGWIENDRIYGNDSKGIKSTPKVVMEEAEAVMQGKRSEIFPWLDGKPDDAKKLYAKAQTEYVRRQQVALLALDNQINNPQSRLTDEDIRKIGVEQDLPTKDVEEAIKRNKEVRPYSDKNAGDAWAAVEHADFRDQSADSLKEYKRVKTQIDLNDKTTASLLTERLNEKWKDAGKAATTVQDLEQRSVGDEIDTLASHGGFINSTTKERMKTGIEKGEIKDKAAFDANQARRMELRTAIQRYADEHPGFKEGELRQYARELMYPDLVQGARDAAARNAKQTEAKTRDLATPQLSPDMPGLTVPGAENLPQTGKPAVALTQEALDKMQRPPQTTLTTPPPVLGTPQPPPATGGTGINAPAPTLPTVPTMAPQATPVTPVAPNAPATTPAPTAATAAPTPAVPEAGPAPTPEAIKTAAQRQLGGSLQGKEDAFLAAGNKYGVDPRLVMAISMHETGNGSSDAVRLANNPGGLMDPKTNWSTLQKFPTLEAGIDAMTKNLKEKYIDQGLTTVAQIQGKYAPIGAANDPRGLNKDWVSGVGTFYKRLGGPQEEMVNPPEVTNVKEALAKLDTRSAENIATLKPEAQGPLANFVIRAKALGRDRGVEVVVTEGYRSPERQAELYAQGRTKPGPIVTNAKPGQSRHQSARAIDVALIRNGKILEGKEYDRIMKELGKMAVASGLEWGGNFKSIYDPDHFQYNG